MWKFCISIIIFTLIFAVQSMESQQNKPYKGVKLGLEVELCNVKYKRKNGEKGRHLTKEEKIIN